MTASWNVPEPRDILEVPLPDGALVYVRRHGNKNGPRLLLSHGCGLAIDSYFPFWSLLLTRFELLLFDLRSHGWNPAGPIRSQNIPTFANDCEHILRGIGARFGEKPVVGVFHSLSGMVALLHEERWKGFAGLVLFDVPIQPPGGRPEDLVEIGEEMSAVARRRRQRFNRREDYADRMRRSPVHQRLLPGMPELIADTTLRASTENGGFELCCPREHEAQVYEYLFGWSMKVDLQRISCPVKVIGADPTEPYSFMPTMDLTSLIGVNYDFLPETTHFLQMESPHRCVNLTLEFLREQSLI